MSAIPRRQILVAAVALVAMTSVIATAPTVSASFPGGDGLLLFSFPAGDGFDTWTVTPDGSDLTMLVPGASFAVWSADGTRIAYVKEMPRPNLPGVPQSDIWVAAADGSYPLRITTNGRDDTQPAWSPNGRWLAFVSNRSGSAEIYKIRSDGSGQAVRLTVRVPRRGDREPDWSPDGSLIAYTSNRPHTEEVRTVPAAGGESSLVKRDFSSPSWSPDGERILGRPIVDGYARLGHIAADGSDLVVIGDGGEEWFGEDPAWSPEGDRFAFMFNVPEDPPTSATATVYVAPINGSSDPVAIAEHYGPVFQLTDLSWQPVVP